MYEGARMYNDDQLLYEGIKESVWPWAFGFGFGGLQIGKR